MKFLKIKYLFSFFLIVSAISCTTKVKNTPEPQAQASTAMASHVLPPPVFKEKVNDEKALVLDVRTPKEYHEGHLKNSTLINFLDDDFEKEIKQLDKNQPIYLYCRTGKRSAKAANLLRENGFTEVYELQGGITAWKEAELPIEN